MKKNLIPAAVVAAAVALVSLGGLSSCKGDKAKQAEKEAIEATEDATLDEAEAKAIDEATAPYGASFFNNPDKKGDTPSDSTYVQTPSGLKYVVISEGTGASPKASDSVTVNYEGVLTDGSMFDSSYQRGEPATFPLNAVIKGWTEGLQTMKTGGKTIFYIPSDLAYGENGIPGVIPGNAPLIFTVELLGVN